LLDRWILYDRQNKSGEQDKLWNRLKRKNPAVWARWHKGYPLTWWPDVERVKNKPVKPLVGPDASWGMPSLDSLDKLSPAAQIAALSPDPVWKKQLPQQYDLVIPLAPDEFDTNLVDGAYISEYLTRDIAVVPHYYRLRDCSLAPALSVIVDPTTGGP